MKEYAEVQASFLWPEIYPKFCNSHKNGKADYDLLLERIVFIRIAENPHPVTAEMCSSLVTDTNIVCIVLKTVKSTAMSLY